MNRLIAVIMGLVVAALILLALNVRSYLVSPLAGLEQPRTYEVPQGASFSRVANELAAQGLLSRPAVFIAWGRFTGQASAIQAGEYELQPGLTPRALLNQLVQGDVKLYPVTILEGWTFREVMTALAANEAVEHTLAGKSDAEIQAALALEPTHPEGQFFPDTYMVPRMTSDVAVLQQAAELMQAQLAKAWEGRAVGLPYTKPYELLIMASIVERETALDAERPQVAGVFVRRLQKRMRLQTDPTVIYGLGAAFDGNLTRKHLTTDNPYNTYTRGGLPPTPIGMPGAGSLLAAGNPDSSEALYFVATGEGDGSHVFSETLDEHNTAVAAYIARLKQNRRDADSQSQGSK